MPSDLSALNLDFDPAKRAKFRRALLRWFDANRRDLPWRVDQDPYRVWLSEIMLQQTRVGAVLNHYRYFLERFPDVSTLARVRLSTVLAAWSGLGYYRRARMLHEAARQIVRQLHGSFPRTSEGWRALPGVGRYTAAAIASICYGECCAVVDGNVKRVLGRVVFTDRAADTQRDLALHSGRNRGLRPGALSASRSVAAERAPVAADYWNLAQQLLSLRRPGDFNQAMMELGATVCLPRNPRCKECPVRAICRRASGFPRGAKGPPVRLDGGRVNLSNGKARQQRKASEIKYFLLGRSGRICLVRRGKQETVMPGMWELPQIMTEGPKTAPILSLSHAIMDTDYRVRVLRIDGADTAICPSPAESKWVQPSAALRLPLTGLARKILRRIPDI